MYTIYSSLPLSPYMTCEQDGLVDGQGDGVCGCGLKPFNVCGLTSGRVRVMVLVGDWKGIKSYCSLGTYLP